MKTLPFLLPVLVFLLFTGCAKDCDPLAGSDDTDPDDNGSGFPVECYGTFKGNAAVNLRYFDPSGNFIEEKNYQFEAQVFVEAPAKLNTAPVVEDNPFNLGIYSVNQLPEGAFSFNSARGFTDPQDGKELMLQYWDFDWDKTTNSVSGELINTGAAQALALNLLNIVDLFSGFVLPTTMKLKTTLTGTVNCDQASLTLKGETTNEIVEFEIVVDAAK